MTRRHRAIRSGSRAFPGAVHAAFFCCCAATALVARGEVAAAPLFVVAGLLGAPPRDLVDVVRRPPLRQHPGSELAAAAGRLQVGRRALALNWGPARLEHSASDGSTIDDLARQASELRFEGSATAIVTVGGKDLLRGLGA